VPNARRDFWIVEAATGERRKITARLRTQTPHAAMWVEEGVWHDVRQLERAAKRFETDIYTRVRAAFGSEWTPGIDNDPRISILHATGLGEDILGYTSSLDEYPSDIHPRSNEAEMITVNVEAVEVGSPTYDVLLAQELQHLIQWHQDRNEEHWVREGLAELAATLMGAQSDRLYEAYLQQTDTPLAAWTGDDSQRGAHLLMTYLYERFGDDGTRALTAEPANGVRGFEAVLQELETQLTFDDLLADWLAANYLDGVLETENTPYGYSGLDLAQPAASAVYDTYPVQADTAVHQLGADYIVLRGEEDLRVQFTGQRQTPLLTEAPPIDHPVWWSNRTDASLTSLTREVDLGDVEEATLVYRVWYDIEPHYDYATVEISVNGGKEWQMLRAPSGTDANPYDNNPGWGYTGKSGDWIREEIDISPYAGDDALIRFSYLTDAAITGEGLLLDDISIPEIYHEGDQQEGEAEASTWNAQGFVLTDGLVPQGYVALLVGLGESQGEDVTVERLPLAEDQSAAWIVPLSSEDLHEAVLILSATAPLTRQPAPYQLTISR
jgi:hypothetical protein